MRRRNKQKMAVIGSMRLGRLSGLKQRLRAKKVKALLSRESPKIFTPLLQFAAVVIAALSLWISIHSNSMNALWAYNISLSARDAAAARDEVERARNDINGLSVMRDDLTAQIAEREQALHALRVESSKVRLDLREQYREKIIAEIPAMWGEHEVPKLWIDVLNGISGSPEVSADTIGREVYLTSIGSLDSATPVAPSGADVQVVKELRQQIVNRCGDDGIFSAQFLRQANDTGKLDGVGRAELLGQAARFFQEKCLAL